MEVKDLIWKDNVSEIDKANGFIDLRSKDEALCLEFFISNTDHTLKPFTDKFRLILVVNRMYYAHDKFHPTIEECKKQSQELYRDIILNAFFKK